MMPGDHGSGDFPTTHWSAIDRVIGDPTRTVAEYNGLLLRYWKPVFYFVRGRGRPLHEAEELTQEFFCRLIDRDWISRADPQRGRFRSFLLTLLIHFLADQGPRRRPRQLSFERGMVAVSTLLSEEDRRFEPPDVLTAEAIYNERWTQAMLERVRQETRRRCEADGHAVWFELLDATLEAAAVGERISQPELARQFDLTPDQARYGLEQAKERFRQLLRSELRSDNCTDAEVLQELTQLPGG